MMIMTTKKKTKTTRARKVSDKNVMRGLGALATSTARLKQLVRDAKQLDPRPPKRPKRELTENLGDRRLGPARIRPTVSTLEKQRKEAMRPLDPTGEWRNDVDDLWEQHLASRRKTAKALEKADAKIPRTPKRQRGPRRPKPRTHAR